MIKGKSLISMGFAEGKAIGLALDACSDLNEFDAYYLLHNLLDDPERFLGNERLDATAREMLKTTLPAYTWPPLETPLDYTVFGSHIIDPNAREQMNKAMSLPIATKGALMPDAHQGYALPIGAVWETEEAISPNAVGVDISCMLMLTVFSESSVFLDEKRPFFEKMLVNNTAFGRESQSKKNVNILADEFNSLTDVDMLEHHEKDKALKQLGSSGGGNHFAEFVEVDYGTGQAPSIGLLTHSGSRRTGFDIAGKYHKIAKDKCKGNLPKELQDYAYLSMDDEAGIEYWRLMNLMGEYALLNHRLIHDAIMHDTGLDNVVERVWNRHNFAWRDEDRGTYLHRKGATPAEVGTRSIIPANMTEPGYLVVGKGFAPSLNSASHGAGRTMSRTAAKAMLAGTNMQEYALEEGISLTGGGLDEHPDAYKNIDVVMAAQKDLVQSLAKMTPKIVRMASND